MLGRWEDKEMELLNQMKAEEISCMSLSSVHKREESFFSSVEQNITLENS